MPDKPLGELCVEMGFISKGALNGVLEKYQKQILLGDLFLNLGIVSVHQMHVALDDQKRSKKRLGQILMEKRFITKARLAEALSIQLGIPKVVPDVNDVEQYLLEKATPTFFQRNRVVPLRYDEDNNAVIVLMDDPLDTAVIADLEKVFGSDIQPAISVTIDAKAFLAEIFDPWNRHRGAEPGFEESAAIDDGGAVQFYPVTDVDLDTAKIRASELRLAEDDHGETRRLSPDKLKREGVERRLPNRTDRIKKSQPAAHGRIPGGKAADSGSKTVEAVKAVGGHAIKLAAVAKDRIVDNGDSIVAKDKAAAVLNFIIASAVEDRATEIHMESFEDRMRVRYRVDGVLLPKTDLPKSVAPAVTSRIKTLSGLDRPESKKDQDGRIEAKAGDKNIDLLVSTYASLWGENVVIRL
jgi:type II secretory ATPase GspE/PulE/Tfp pilus assembly ATPase PilB-like protein